MSDIEHDSHEEYGGAVGATPKQAPELSDTELDKIDAMEELEAKRKRNVVPIPADRAAMLAARYQMRTPEEERRLEAENAEWMSLDNEELWTRVT